MTRVQEISFIPTASIAKKAVMAITALLVIGFLLVHFAGNMLLFVGPQAYNAYAHKLTSSPLIYPAEAFLLLIFGYHIITGIQVWHDNRRAKKQKYAMQKRLGKGTFMSKTMIISGIIILAFLIFHLATFKYGQYIPSAENPEIRDIYSLVVQKFTIWWYVLFYVTAVCCMGMHLAHGFQSAFRTLGLSNQGTLAVMQWISYGVAVFFAVGYSVFPVYFFLFRG